MSDRVSKALQERLRGVSRDKQSEAWRRIDGGQDLSIGAMLADEAADRIDALEKALNPSAWTKAMSDAWHQNIPDTQRAFYALYRAALSPPSDNSDAQAGSMK